MNRITEWRRHFGLALVPLLLGTMGPISATGADELVIVGGTVIDGTGRPPVSDAVVYIENGKIRRIAAGGDRPSADDGARVVDANGKFLVPGIVDAHSHIDSIGG